MEPNLLFVIIKVGWNLVIFYLETIIRPWTELHLAFLIVEWKPCNVYLASTLKYTGWYVQTRPIMLNNDICWVGTIKSFVRTENQNIFHIINNTIFVFSIFIFLI